VCDLETSGMRRPWPTGGVAPNKKRLQRKISYKQQDEHIDFNSHFVSWAAVSM